MTRLTRKQHELAERVEVAKLYQDRTRALSQWRDRVREQLNGRSLEAILLAEMAALLSPLLEYLSAAKTANIHGVRVWCVLYAVRPELINYETFQQCADRFGCTQENVVYHFARLKKLFPAFVLAPRPASTESTLKRCRGSFQTGAQRANQSRRDAAIQRRKEDGFS